MMKWEIKDFYEKNKTYCVITVVVIVLCVACAWLYADAHRNDPIHHDTDATVAELEKRINGIEQRIGTMQERLDKAEKTVSGTIVTIRESRENAVTVADGISGAEERLESAIQRSGRIQNLIDEIERANR